MREDARRKRAAEIEAAAYAVLEKKGYDGLSMLAVAKAAKASNETLYRWYGDKLGLFAALIDGNTQVVRDALGGDDGDTPLEDLARVGPKLLTMLLGPRAVALNRAAAVDGSGSVCTVDLVMSGNDVGRPGRFYIGQDGDDFFVAKAVAKPGHTGFVTAPDHFFGTVLGDQEQLFIGVVPSVARRIMRRGGQVAVFIAVAPVGLALKIGAVTGCAILLIQRLADLCDLPVLIGKETGGPRRGRERLQDHDSGHREDDGKCRHHEYVFERHKTHLLSMGQRFGDSHGVRSMVRSRENCGAVCGALWTVAAMWHSQGAKET